MTKTQMEIQAIIEACIRDAGFRISGNNSADGNTDKLQDAANNIVFRLRSERCLTVAPDNNTEDAKIANYVCIGVMGRPFDFISFSRPLSELVSQIYNAISPYIDFPKP